MRKWWQQRPPSGPVELDEQALVAAALAAVLSACDVVAAANRASLDEVRGWVEHANRASIPVRAVDVMAGRITLADGSGVVLAGAGRLEPLALVLERCATVVPWRLIGDRRAVAVWFRAGGVQLRIDADGAALAER